MTKLSLSTALASFLIFYGASNALALPSSKNPTNNEEGTYEGIRGGRSMRHMRSIPSFNVGGVIISHGWFAIRDDYYHKYGIKYSPFSSREFLDKYGLTVDSMLHITAESNNDALGITYGGSLEVNIPNLQKGTYVSFKKVGNRGSRVFVDTSLGNFGFGYQAGVDSLMKIDAFSIGAGDTSNMWMRYVNLRNFRDPLSRTSTKDINKYFLENAFYLSTGLYSESIFEGGNRFSNSIFNVTNEYVIGDVDLVNTLPFRFSYLSPNFGGARLGISYSPLGYDEEKIAKTHSAYQFIAEKDSRNINLPPGVPREFLIEDLSFPADTDPSIRSITQAVLDAIPIEDRKAIITPVGQPDISLEDMIKQAMPDAVKKATKNIAQATLDAIPRNKQALIVRNGNAVSKIIGDAIEKVAVDAQNNAEHNYYFPGLWGKIEVPVDAKTTRKGFLIPMYGHILNFAATYERCIGDVDLTVSVIGEYAKNKNKMLRHNISFPRMNDIKNAAVGGVLGYKGFKLAGSYGYLGKIDHIEHMYSYDESSGEFSINYSDKALVYTKNTYTWTLGAGYERGRVRVSSIYRGSNYSGNKLHETALGVEYDVSGNTYTFSGAECKAYVNYHHFFASSSLAQDALIASESNRGAVLLTGIKMKF